MVKLIIFILSDLPSMYTFFENFKLFSQIYLNLPDLLLLDINSNLSILIIFLIK